MSASTQLHPRTATHTRTQESEGEDAIVRFETHQRIQHFLMMSTFIALALTGLPQRFSELGASQWWVSTLGGLESVRTIHRAAGVIMLLDCVYHVGYLFVRIGVQRRFGAFQMIPTPKDVKDAFHMVRFFLGLETEKPRFGRFSYLEKFDYWAVFWGIVMMVGSGFVYWFPVFFAKFLPHWVLASAQIIHGEEATLAILFLFCVHFYNVHLKPSIFPMSWIWLNGQISLEAMRDEHPAEYDRRKSGK